MNNEPLYNKQLYVQNLQRPADNWKRYALFQLLGTLIWFCDFIIACFLDLSITFLSKNKYSEFSVIIQSEIVSDT